ncbi:MAG: DUF362 domain-containing protein [Polyangiaceae bacterium]|nr:DUF362 domain-containing protein [Polyangiaceae bacterium]
MSKPKSEGLSRRGFLGASIGAVVTAGIGCGDTSDADSGGAGSGGSPAGSGGSPSGGDSGSSSTSATGGSTGSQMATGGSPPGSGGVSSGTTGWGGTGGATATGGTDVASGGQSATGGNPATGGSAQGGRSAAVGGRAAGGRAATGGTTAAGGDAATGGTTATGGAAATGGTSAGAQTPLAALVRDADVNKAVKAAIEAVGGFPDLTGKTVMLRPNAVIADGPPYTTGAEVVRAVIQAIKAKGTPAAILVGEDSLAGDTADYMRANGIQEAATSEGATPLDMSSGGTRTVKPEGATNWPDGITCFESFLDADYVINMPVCKSHSYANYTMAIKAWYGNQTNFRNTHPTNLSPALAELHLARKSDFVILDATKALLSGGPFSGSNDVVVSPGIIVASPDTVAADVTGLCIMKHYLKTSSVTGGALNNLSVWKQPQIIRAMELTSLGWTTDKAFKYQAVGIDEAETIMAYRDA